MNLCRVRGIQVAVHASFALLLGWIALEGWRAAPAAGVPAWQGAVWSVATLLVFFACVLLHEFGHAFTAMRYGVRVPRILLLPIGGMAQFDRIPRRPAHELAITLAGPAVNFVLAGALWLVTVWPEGWWEVALPVSAGDLLRQLFLLNLVMGVFNLLPIFPMDGGRVLRALLALRLPYLRATWWAATVAKVLGTGALAAALWQEHWLAAVLFAFILFAGEAELRDLRRREREDAHWRETLARLRAEAAGAPLIVVDPRS